MPLATWAKPKSSVGLARRPGVAVVRAGTFDWSEDLRCQAHIFTNYKQQWVDLDPGVPAWGEAPDASAFKPH